MYNQDDCHKTKNENTDVMIRQQYCPVGLNQTSQRLVPVKKRIKCEMKKCEDEANASRNSKQNDLIFHINNWFLKCLLIFSIRQVR